MTRFAQSSLLGPLASLMASTQAWGATITACEVRIDVGRALTMNLVEKRERPEYREGDFTAELPSSDLSVGPHWLEVRCQSDNGVWSEWQGQWIRVGGKVTLTGGEYFFDVDPGPGNGTPIPQPADGVWDEPEEDIEILRVSDDLGPGYHVLYVRCRDS